VPSGLSLNWSAPQSTCWKARADGTLAHGLAEATLAASGRKAGVMGGLLSVSGSPQGHHLRTRCILGHRRHVLPYLKRCCLILLHL
jgi:hypothetical protein